MTMGRPAAHKQGMTNIDPAKVNAREASRQSSGEFGSQIHSAPDVTVDMDAIRAAERLAPFQNGMPVLRRNPDGTFAAGVILDNSRLGGQGDDVITVDFEDGEADLDYHDLVTPAEASSAIIQKLRDRDVTYDLYWVDRDSELRAGLKAAVLSGDTDALEPMYEDWADYRSDQIDAAVNGILEDEGIERGILDEDALADFVVNRDESDLLAGLLRNTPDQLMRTRLDTVGESSLYSGHPDDAQKKREAKIARVLARNGLEITSDEQREAIEELVANGPFDWHDGVSLEVIYYDDLASSSVLDLKDWSKKSRDLAFKDPHVLLIDRINGSGFDVTIPGTLKTQITPDRPAILDEDPDHGYSWDDVCGLHKPAYRTEMTSTWSPDSQPAAEAA